MGRVLLIVRLAARDLRRRRGEAVMLLIVIMAATSSLALGLVLHGVTAQPYQQTRQATAGPDVVATAFPVKSGPAADPAGLHDMAPLARASGFVGYSGPFPVAFPVLRANGRTDAVLAEGRKPGPASVDQPKLTAGSWVRRGEVVVERSFANALGIHPGDRVTLNGQQFKVAGIAVTAAFQNSGLGFLEGSNRWPNPGLIWLSESAARSFATSAAPLGYVLNLKLADPAEAVAFANRFTAGGNYKDNNGPPVLIPWQQISQQDGLLVRTEQKIILVGSWLLALMAIASLAILVGGRMAEQIRRVGLLKAVGATPALVAAVLLAEYLALALVAAFLGLVVGRLAAPLLTSPGAALLGSAGAPQLAASTIGIVVAAAVAVSVLATFLPALRAARTSTVHALADAARQPRRRAWLLARSARLPVSLLLAVRVAARRPRRTLLNVASITVTVSGIVALLLAHATVAATQFGSAVAGSANFNQFDVGFSSKTAREDQVLLIVSILLIVLAAVNAIFITQATVQDARHSSAVTRALGATPGQLTGGLSAAQTLPALMGALVGIAGGFGLFAIANKGGSASQPSAWWVVAVLLGTVIAVAGLTAVPARVGARRPVAEILQSEAA
jgi:ABC-type antimicrobial peptide transport system permease subunit